MSFQLPMSPLTNGVTPIFPDATLANVQASTSYLAAEARRLIPIKPLASVLSILGGTYVEARNDGVFLNGVLLTDAQLAAAYNSLLAA